MVTLEKVETAEEMPENDTEPAEPEIKEDAVEEKEIEKEIEKRNNRSSGLWPRKRNN